MGHFGGLIFYWSFFEPGRLILERHRNADVLFLWQFLWFIFFFFYICNHLFFFWRGKYLSLQLIYTSMHLLKTLVQNLCTLLEFCTQFKLTVFQQKERFLMTGWESVNALDMMTVYSMLPQDDVARYAHHCFEAYLYNWKICHQWPSVWCCTLTESSGSSF